MSAAGVVCASEKPARSATAKVSQIGCFILYLLLVSYKKAAPQGVVLVTNPGPIIKFVKIIVSRTTSVRFIGFVVYPSLIGNPIHFPSLAAIVGVRLLEVGLVGGGVAPEEADDDHFAFPAVLRIERTDSVLELADLGRVENANFAVNPVEAPLMRFRIVQTEGQAFDVAAGTVGLKLLDLRTPIPDFTRGG